MSDTLPTFDDLGFSAPIMRAIAEIGYTTPTEIQAKAIPQILMARDVVGIAQTGTGKTASFTLPMIEILAGGIAKARMPRALVLTPTRELAAQIADNFDQYSKYSPLSKCLIVGGVGMNDQINVLMRGVDVLIATPGRLLDLFERGNVLLNDIKMLVIDEADRMLDMGFVPDIERILKLLPPLRQTMLFSATMPGPIQKLAEKFMSNARTVSVAPQSTTGTNVTQNLVQVATVKQKDAMLYKLLVDQKVTNAFVFCNRKRDISNVAQYLVKKGVAAAPLHGDMAQSSRTETLQAFKDGKITVLICSDVVARGIDISGVSHVFNYDVPFGAEDYVHRIGRTGRAGKSGVSFTFATPDDAKLVAAVEKVIRKPIPIMNMGDVVAEVVVADDSEKPVKKARSAAPKARSVKTEAPKAKTPVVTENISVAEEKPDAPAAAPHKPTASPRTPTPAPRARRNHHEDDDASVAGFGDHLPDFMRGKS